MCAAEQVTSLLVGRENSIRNALGLSRAHVRCVAHSGGRGSVWMAVKTVLGDSTSYCRCVGWPGGAAALWVVAGVCVGGT